MKAILNGKAVKIKTIERTLEENEKRLNAIFNHQYQLTGLIDIRGRILMANKTALEFVGAKESDVVGSFFWDGPWWDYSQRPQVQSAFERAITGEFIRFETTHLNSEGNAVKFDFSFRPVLDQYGNVDYVVPEGCDLTEKYRSEEIFSVVFTNSPLPVTISTVPDGKYIDVNPVFEKKSGYRKKEIIGKSILDLGIYADPTDHVDIVKKLNEDGLLNDYKITFKIKSGEHRLCRLFSEFIEIDNQRCLLSVVHDDTEQIRAEQAVFESKQRYKGLLEMLPEVVFETDQDYNLTYVNQRAFDLFGYSKEDYGKGINGFDIIAPEDRAKAKEYLEQRAGGAQHGTIEYRAIKKDGSVFPILLHATSIIKNGEMVGVFGIIMDISERKKAEHEKLESEARFKRLFEDLGDAVYVTSLGGENKGQILEANSAATKQTGYSKVELLNKNIIQDFSISETRSLSTEEWEEKIQQGEIVSATEKKRRKDGTEYWTEVKITPIDYKGRKACLSINRDITERIKAEQDLNIALQKAQESDKLKSAFLASMSHEIRTPLNAIIGFSNIIANSTNDPQLMEFSSLINSQNDLLLNLVNDILDFAKLEAGTLEIVHKRIDLNSLIDELFLMFHSKSNSDRQLIHQKQTIPLTIYSDKQRIEQVFTNLVSNALKFTEKGSVTFGYEVNGNSEIVCFVKDTGKGIPSSQHESIFERFTKIDSFSQGTGLGLAISKNIVELLGGRIWLESEPGRGSSFYFTIPVSKQEPKKNILIKGNKNNLMNELSADRKNYTFLVAEDDEVNYLYLREILRVNNGNILHASNGLEAIDIVKANDQIDIVLMDIKMPVMNGYEATRKIKNIRPHLPVIAITAYALPEDEQKAKNAGCDYYIAKPINKNELYKIIKKNMERVMNNFCN